MDGEITRTNTQQLRVVKLGGSLLSETATDFSYDNGSGDEEPVFEANGPISIELAAKISHWISIQPPMKTVWIVGGGEAVEKIRKCNVEKRKDEELHWICIGIMETNAKWLKHAFPNWLTANKIESVRGLDKSTERHNWIFFPNLWLKSAQELTPHSWNVTSDSIAAVLASELGASELVLLKSCDAPAKDIRSLCKVGFVDKHFPIALTKCKPGLSCRFVNFADQKQA